MQSAAGREGQGYAVISAYKKATDGSHYVISRPYALIKVSEPGITTICPPADDTLKKTPLVAKPAKVKKVKATVKKSKKKKKTIKITWKKVKKATGYRVYISKKQKKKFKKCVDTKKLKASILRKKGTYFIKVRAYKKNGKEKVYGSYSKTIKVKVK